MTILVQQQLRDLLGKLTTAFWRNDGALVCPAYRDGETVYVESWRPVAEAASTDYARFIAAANPTNVLALLDEIDRLKHSLGVANANRDHLARELRQALGVQDRLKAESAELRRDAERYRWLRDRTGYRLFGYLTCQPASIVDAEIDQAMTKGKQS